MNTRRDFVKSSTLALTAGLLTTGCAFLEKYAIKYEITADITTPHSHQGGLTKEQLASTQPLEIDITGFSQHAHIVKISVETLQRIIAGETITIESSTHGGHSHDVTFNV